jgi:hypothetical protein
VTASLLEKAVVDNGFDRELPMAGEWLAFASTQSPLRIWLGMTQAGVALMALSQQNLTIALGELGGPCAKLLLMTSRKPLVGKARMTAPIASRSFW